MDAARKTPDQVTQRLDELYRSLQDAAATQAGYPCNQLFDYSELYRFLDLSINNVGDPFHNSNFWVNTHEFEREVVNGFAYLMGMEPERCWGYVTHGGTEGNMYGLYLARELYPDGLVYFSEDTHYSVLKTMHILNARSIMIKSRDSGEMDYDDLYETVRIHRDVPGIVLANIGTTMKGAVDDVRRIRDIFRDLAMTDYYIHADAALSGMILPFVEEPQPHRFEDGYHSIAVSGHKMIGAPLPCGIVLAKRDSVARIARAIEYVGVLDTTLSGSRNAFTPLILWYALKRNGLSGFRQTVADALAVADYAVARFEENGIPAWRHKNSLTVVFPRPPQSVTEKWQIAVYRDIAHIITMPHVTRETVDAIAADCAQALQQGDCS